MEETSLEEFQKIWNKLSKIKKEVLHKKKNDLTKDTKPASVFDFLN